MFSVSTDLQEFFITLLGGVLSVFIGGMLVFILAWTKVEKFIFKLKVAEKSRAENSSKSTSDTVSGLRLAAYERLVILVNRMEVSALLEQLSHISFSRAAEIHQALVTQMEAEYQHNVSQQLLVSDRAWQAIETFRSQQMTLLASALEVDSQITAENYQQLLRKFLAQLPENPALSALQVIKAEFNK